MAFEGIQQAMVSADPRKVSFQTHEDVAKASESLYQAVVDSIENLILLTTDEKLSCEKYSVLWTPLTCCLY